MVSKGFAQRKGKALAGLLALLLLILGWGNASAQVYEKVFSFTDAADSTFAATNGLTLGSDGNYYGTTLAGGSYGHGAIYKVTPAGVATILVSFNGTDGSGPNPGLVQYSDGNFYGTAGGGGANNAGTFFKVTPGGALTVLYSMQVGNNGQSGLYAGLVLGKDNNFYGVTEYEGNYNLGSVFRFTPTGVFTTLASFNFSNGLEPVSALIQGSDGNFYGTTYGGGYGYGTVFQVTPAGVITTLHSFSNSDGANLYSSLVQGTDGNFYGVTANGGSSVGQDPSGLGYGTIFKVSAGGAFTSLVNFNAANGAHSFANLVLGADGNLYGATRQGGSSIAQDPLGFGYGTIFSVTPSGTLTTLVNFNGANGGLPYHGLTPTIDGNFFGTTTSGTSTANGSGTLFEMTPAGVLTTLDNFPESAGNNPQAGLVQGNDGNFYGTTYFGPAIDGTVFKITPAGTLTTLASFAYPSIGAYPGQLAQGSDGNFYGPTSVGGTTFSTSFSGYGIIFKITPGGTLSTLVNFNNTNGSNFNESNSNGSHAGLIQGNDGNFYGVTDYGGINNNGTIFKLSTAGVLTTLVNFNGNGADPQGSLVLGNDGNFYGTTSSGGSSNDGTIFQLTPAGVLTTLVNFNGTNGSTPLSGLIQANDGNLYGTTSSGGSSSDGTIFKVTTAGVLTTLVNFNGTNGSTPSTSLLQAADGNIYGTTSAGGAGTYGTIFQMTLGGSLTTLYDYVNDTVDSNPQGPLIQASDGNLYGTTAGETNIGDGAIYRLIFPGAPNVYLNAPTVQGPVSALFTLEANARGASTTLVLNYGTTSSSLSNSVSISSNLTGNLTTLLGTTLTNLTPGTTYYYQVVATNSHGTTTTPVASFSTYAPPTATTIAASSILSTSAQFNGTVNAVNYNTTVVFQYSTDGGNTFPFQVTATPGTVTGNTATAVSASVAGLTNGTTYYYRISATNAGGTTVSGATSFTTLTNPVATVSAATFVGSQSAQFNGTVNAEGAATTVTFQYGTDNVNFPYSVGGTPGTVTGNSAVPVTASISNSTGTPLVQGTTYYYRIAVSSAGGTGVSASVSFSLDILSGFSRLFPNTPPASQGYLLIYLTPTITPSPGWNFVGEQLWRQSGSLATGLVTGTYNIEYQPAPGYSQPPPETISVTSGAAPTVLTRQYYPTSGGTPGGMSIVLAPQNLATAQWQILGQSQLHNSGDIVTGLAPGNYLVQCTSVANYTTPPVSSITVPSGLTPVVTLTYFYTGSPSGVQPKVLPFFSTVTSSATPSLPYAFVGQIRSDVGSATGFVVEDRVVATAAHVVFDDGSLSYVTGLQWLFQRYAGSYEPVPQIPQGYYVMSGYAAQRTAEATPGVSSLASQNLDAAALYFLASAGGGGYSGYLASDSSPNEFLTSSNPKILVGYPVDGITDVNQGQMFATSATAPVTASFAQVLTGNDNYGNPYQVYTTSALTSVGGNSGGPLCVQYTGSNTPDDGNYYPAAIYLGGSGGQTSVRAIDSNVIALFNAAEISGEGGANNLGGGISQANTGLSGTNASYAWLQVNFAPGTASATMWGTASSAQVFTNGATEKNIYVGTSGSVTLYVTPPAGFLTPPAATITLTGGYLSTATVTLEGITGQPQNATASAGGNVAFSVGVSGAPSINPYQWQRSTDGVNFVNISGATSATYTRTNLTTADNGSTYRVVVTWGADGSQTSTAAVLTVNQSLPADTADTPVMPPWALALLAMLLFITSSRFLPKSQET